LQEWITEHLRELDREGEVELAARELARLEMGRDGTREGVGGLGEGGEE